eukprot:1878944-Rhodomonas_salina.1
MYASRSPLRSALFPLNPAPCFLRPPLRAFFTVFLRSLSCRCSYRRRLRKSGRRWTSRNGSGRASHLLRTDGCAHAREIIEAHTSDRQGPTTIASKRTLAFWHMWTSNKQGARHKDKRHSQFLTALSADYYGREAPRTPTHDLALKPGNLGVEF